MSYKLFDNLVKIGNNQPELRDDIAPVLSYLKKARGKTSGWKDEFERAAEQLDVGGFPASAQNAVMEGFKAVNKDNDPSRALKKFMKARQDIDGRAGSTLDQMIASLRSAAGPRKASRDVQSSTTKVGVLREAIQKRNLDAYIDEKKVEARKTVNSGEFGVSWEIKQYKKGWQLYIVLLTGVGKFTLADDQVFQSAHSAADELIVIMDNLSSVGDKAINRWR